MTPRDFRRRLLGHYRLALRDLPWRGAKDAYHVWISEVILQQTRVATGALRYRQFLAEFPDVQSLARASVERVCEAWAGLGYYTRARNLHAAARSVVEEYGGSLPRTARELRRLPGVGVYTAGAIASIAFDERVAAVDGNAERVLARVYAVDAPPKSPQGRRRIAELAALIVEAGPCPGEINQAIMDLGALVCTPRQPDCPNCPLADGCVARIADRITAYPARRAARAPRKLLPVAFVWHADRHGLWLERRPTGGLWAGQWQLPGEEGPGCVERLSGRFGDLLSPPITSLRHELSHRIVEASVFGMRGIPALVESATLRPFREPLAAPISGLARRAILAARAAGRTL